MYNPTDEQIASVINAGYFTELNAHTYNVANYNDLSESEQTDANEFARRLFEMDDVKNIWDVAVYC